MNTHDQSALFAVIDALQLPMTPKKGENSATGSKAVKIKCGPLTLKFPIRARTDMVKDGAAAVLCHLRGHLWGYVYAHLGKTETTMWMSLFNGDSLDFEDFAGGSVTKTVEKIKKKIVATYEFKNNQWKLAPPSDPQ